MKLMPVTSWEEAFGVMERAVERIWRAIRQEETILIHGDFSQYVVVDRVGMTVVYQPVVRLPAGTCILGRGVQLFSGTVLQGAGKDEAAVAKQASNWLISELFGALNKLGKR